MLQLGENAGYSKGSGRELAADELEEGVGDTIQKNNDSTPV